ncbi:MAG TPA: hypothetical protein EYP14_19190, partial [Planctomycetaceae bacterium]|nr:hypothetical protein [Planctomycetaceae bacterium]
MQSAARTAFDAHYWRATLHSATRRMMARDIARVIEQGEGVRALAQMWQQHRSLTFSRVRAWTVGRTESTAALNGGMFRVQSRLAAQGLVIGRRWEATEDDAVRPTHAAADGQVRKLSEPFDVGGHKAMYPGDPALPAAERVNCRCVLLDVFPGEEDTVPGLVLPREPKPERPRTIQERLAEYKAGDRLVRELAEKLEPYDRAIDAAERERTKLVDRFLEGGMTLEEWKRRAERIREIRAVNEAKRRRVLWKELAVKDHIEVSVSFRGEFRAGQKRTIERMIKEASSAVARGGGVPDKMHVVVEASERRRAGMSPEGVMYVPRRQLEGPAGPELRSTVAHEFGHYLGMKSRDREWERALEEYRTVRAAGRRPVRLAERFPDAGYKENEIALDCKFAFKDEHLSLYAGKLYGA